jgi:hypothetical protein
MGVMKALKGYAAEGFREYFNGLLKDKQLTLADFCRKVYGVDEKGRPKGTGPVSRILGGQSPLTKNMAQRWAVVFDIRTEELLNNSVSKEPQKPKEAKIENFRVASPTISAPNKNANSPFSLTINSDGTANLRLELYSIPLDAALKYVEIAKIPELLGIKAVSKQKIITDSNKTSE